MLTLAPITILHNFCTCWSVTIMFHYEILSWELFDCSKVRRRLICIFPWSPRVDYTPKEQ